MEFEFGRLGRCWQEFDPELKRWPELKKSDLLESIFEDKVERKFWTNLWQKLMIILKKLILGIINGLLHVLQIMD